jgi:hypothetical protein
MNKVFEGWENNEVDCTLATVRFLSSLDSANNSSSSVECKPASLSVNLFG